MQTSSVTSSSNAWAILQLLQQQAQSAQFLPTNGQTSPASAGAAANTGLAGPSLSGDLFSSLLGVQSQPDPSALAASLIQKADANGDGQLSADEISQALTQNGSAPDITQAFASLDANGDGQLSQDELAAGIAKLQQDGGAQHAHGHHGHHHHHGGGGGVDALAQALSDNLDTNGDGGVSIAELTAAAPSGTSAGDTNQLFAALDTNGDGAISQQELTSAFQRLLAPDQAAQSQTV